VPIGIVVVAGLALAETRRRRRRRPATWAHQVAADLERGGMRLGRKRRVDETLTAYGERLSHADPAHGDHLVWTTRLVERSTYGSVEPSADEITAALAFTRRFRSRRTRSAPPVAPAQDRDTDSASSKEAPAASRGR
jgi:hypothetical protein